MLWRGELAPTLGSWSWAYCAASSNHMPINYYSNERGQQMKGLLKD
jgi:hypothetical protein